MAYKDINGLDRATGETTSTDIQTLKIEGTTIELPHDSYIRDANITRDGADLMLESSEGTIIIDNYFSGADIPTLTSPSGAELNPSLVNSFISNSNQYAQSASMNDASPVGAVQEISGSATITRGDGTTEELSIGSPVYQGDVIETESESAVNVAFVDESSFAVSEETRLAIDEFVFDPSSQGGVQNFSVLKGVFVYTSGLIGREDPDDVSIETPVGSIGIRGTIIAGDVDQGEITVVEGAIVLRNPLGEEMTLASQFETGKFTSNNGIQNLGQKAANDVVEKFSIVSNVSPSLFSSINDAAAEAQPQINEVEQETKPDAPLDNTQNETQFDADGATDKNGDSEVDGTVEDTNGDPQASEGAALDDANNTPEGESPEGAPEQGQAMNPMATQIAQAMGMVDPNGAPIMSSTMMTTTHASGMEMTGESLYQMDGDAKNETSNEIMKKAYSLESAEGQTDPQIWQEENNNPQLPSTNGAINVAPEALNATDLGIPADYFKATVGSEFRVEFGELFKDENPGDTLTYTLNAETVDILTGAASTNNGVNVPGIIDSWSFNTTTGALDILFKDDISTINDTDFNLSAYATDSSGAVSNNVSLNLNILASNEALANGNIASGSTGQEFGNEAKDFDISNTDGVTIFADNRENILTIGNNVTNSEVHTGSGNDDITISGFSSDNNTIFLGYGNDIIRVNSVADVTKAYGMDGNDVFELAGSTLNSMQTGTLSNFLFDAGSDNNGNFGDTLIFKDGANINFTALNTHNHSFKNFERIGLADGATNTVTLSFGDVMNITDNRNELFIDADSSDTINLAGFSAFGDLTADGTRTVGADTYNAYEFSNGTDTVTLYVDEGALNVT